MWRRAGGTWKEGGSFGRLPSDARASPFVASLADGGADLWMTTSDGVRYALWRSADGDDWERVDTPARGPVTAGDHILSVAADPDGVLLLADDGATGRVWTAR